MVRLWLTLYGTQSVCEGLGVPLSGVIRELSRSGELCTLSTRPLLHRSFLLCHYCCCRHGEKFYARKETTGFVRRVPRLSLPQDVNHLLHTKTKKDPHWLIYISQQRRKGTSKMCTLNKVILHISFGFIFLMTLSIIRLVPRPPPSL